MGLEEITTNKIYLNIVNGTIARKVDETTENAKRREYEKPDGSKGVKWEHYYKNVSGKITGLTFKDTPFGEQFIISLKDVDENYDLQFGVDTKYFTDFGKKISNIDLGLDVNLSPFDFEADGKRRTGISIKQGETKLTNYFWDAENKVSLHNFPQPEDYGNNYDSDDWKMYFIKVKKFLKNHIENISPAIQTTPFEMTDNINEDEHDDLLF